MNRFVASITIAFLLVAISFGTWQLFLGNFNAAFSTLPFLVIIYFFVPSQRKLQSAYSGHDQSFFLLIRLTMNYRGFLGSSSCSQFPFFVCEQLRID
jgi:hypothetical protein